MADLGLAFFGILFGTVLTAGIVGAAVIAQRSGRTAWFVRRHIRAIWLVLGIGWGLLAASRFLGQSPELGHLQTWVALVASFSALMLAIVQKPPSPKSLDGTKK